MRQKAQADDAEPRLRSIVETLARDSNDKSARAQLGALTIDQLYRALEIASTVLDVGAYRDVSSAVSGAIATRIDQSINDLVQQYKDKKAQWKSRASSREPEMAVLLSRLTHLVDLVIMHSHRSGRVEWLVKFAETMAVETHILRAWWPLWHNAESSKCWERSLIERDKTLLTSRSRTLVAIATSRSLQPPCLSSA
jgi:hypothetical protein